MKKLVLSLCILAGITAHAQEDIKPAPSYIQFGIGQALVDVKDTNYKDTYAGGFLKGLTSNFSFGKYYTLDKSSDKWLVNTGLNFNFHQVRFNNEKTITDINGKTELVNSGYTDIKKSRLLSYEISLSAYIEKRFGESPERKYSIKDRWYAGIGGHVGINYLGTFQKYEHNGHTYKNTTMGNYNKSPFIYGAGAYVGYDIFILKFNYNFNPIFKESFAPQHLFTTSFIFNIPVGK